jgi:hypothetical protein
MALVLDSTDLAETGLHAAHRGLPPSDRASGGSAPAVVARNLGISGNPWNTLVVHELLHERENSLGRLLPFVVASSNLLTECRLATSGAADARTSEPWSNETFSPATP